MQRTVGAGLGLVVIAGCVGLMAACGGPSSLDGLGPGDYVAFRISNGTAKEDGNCGVADPNHVETTSLRNGATIIVYGLAESDGTTGYELDDGGATLDGTTQDDGSYVFKGTDTIVDTNGQTQTTTKESITVKLVPNGSAVAGTEAITNASSCAGPCGGFQPTTCTATFGFTGVQIDDASVDVSGASGANPTPTPTPEPEDACSQLGDLITACQGGTSAAGGGTTCTAAEEAQAQCVLDADIDVCAVFTDPTSSDAMTFSQCYQ